MAKGSKPKGSGTHKAAAFLSLHEERPLSPDHDLSRTIKRALTNTFDFTWFEDNPHSFRVSSFPYCPVMDLYDRVHEPVKTETFGKAFYTNVGTTVHEKLMQTYMLKISEYGPYVYGSWKCTQCGLQVGPCIQKKGIKRLARKTKDSVCQAVGCHVEYVEMEFQFGEGSGHLDLLMHYKGRWIAWEFKTTGSFLFTAQPSITERYYPDPKHKVQIQTYCALLKLCHGIIVDGYGIVYINRDKVEFKAPTNGSGAGRVNQDRWGFRSFVYEWNAKKQRVFEDRIVRAQAGRAAVKQAMVSSKLKSPHTTAILDARPCTNRAVYEGYMDAKFFGDKKCPFFENGKCFKAGAMDAEVNKLWSAARKLAATPTTKKLKDAERKLRAKRLVDDNKSSSFGGINVATQPSDRKRLW